MVSVMDVQQYIIWQKMWIITLANKLERWQVEYSALQWRQLHYIQNQSVKVYNVTPTVTLYTNNYRFSNLRNALKNRQYQDFISHWLIFSKAFLYYPLVSFMHLLQLLEKIRNQTKSCLKFKNCKQKQKWIVTLLKNTFYCLSVKQTSFFSQIC